jgi:hypothetical protein
MKLIGNQTLVDLVTSDRKKLSAINHYARDYELIRLHGRSEIKKRWGPDYELVVNLSNYPRAEMKYGGHCSCGGNRIGVSPGIIYTKPDRTQGTYIFRLYHSPHMLATLCIDCNEFHNRLQEHEEQMHPYD